jgi:putative ABC transport system ATP-binding protein
MAAEVIEEASISVRHVNHSYGSGALRKQILFDINADIRAGEIVLLTGPSGSGKTTLLTLIGGLRSTQEGSLRVLGEELSGASNARLTRVRRRIGFIFQAHNLLDMLPVQRNVEMALSGGNAPARGKRQDHAAELLSAVGLGHLAGARVGELSGGQKQRVAVARALAGHPRIVLADEPTASLDSQSGRDVVHLLRDLAKREGCAVLLCTHDNRILDVADRILHVDDGRLSSFTSAVLSSTRQLLDGLARNNRQGELTQQVRGLSLPQFALLLERVTGEFQTLLDVMNMSHNDAFESMLDQVLEAFTLKIGQVLDADRATLFLVDRETKELWSKVAQGAGERPIEIRIPIDSGIAGRVAATGRPMNVPDAYSEPLFNKEVDRRTGYRTRSVLCMPIVNSRDEVFAVVQLLNKGGEEAFDEADERLFRDFASSIGVILESWSRMRSDRPVTPEAPTASGGGL